MLAPMLDWRTILWCHAQVPVLYWPVLWHWLERLSVTLHCCHEEGRRFVCWHLERNGTIWVEYQDESDAERARRGALPPDFDRAPWRRAALPGTGPRAPVFAAPGCWTGASHGLAAHGRARRAHARFPGALNAPAPALAGSACRHPP